MPRTGRAFASLVDDQRAFYEEYFRWEQATVVGPAVEAAVANFHWRLMKWFCLRPWIWFSYFRVGRSLIFRNFADAEERTQKGLAAFDWAVRKGWDRIEASLVRNPLFPRNAELVIQDTALAVRTRPKMAETV